jgi:hypothetical protein
VGRERLVREVTALRKKVAEFEEAAKAVVEEWDANEIGQLDGEYIDKLRDLLPAPPRDVAAEMNELAASQPPIPPDVRARMDEDRKKAEAERDAQVWKCAKKTCGWEGTPVSKDFGDRGKAPTCGQCGSEDVFPKNDGGWPKEEE